MRIEGKWAFVTHMWGGISVFDISNPALPVYKTELFTLWRGGNGFTSDRFVTTYTHSDYPSGNSSVDQRDQVMELCR